MSGENKNQGENTMDRDWLNITLLITKVRNVECEKESNQKNRLTKINLQTKGTKRVKE